MQNKFRSKGIMLVLSSPSGAGKSSLARKLIIVEDDIDISVSFTTRPQRPGEVDGVDYCFVTNEHFNHMKSQGKFLECATVFGNQYGTLRKHTERKHEKVHDLVFDIDWQGARSLKSQMPEDIVSVYILPPSMAELRKRLAKRAQDDAKVIDMRMAQALSEAEHYSEYDYVIINDDFDLALLKLRAILTAERVKRHRQPFLAEFIRDL